MARTETMGIASVVASLALSFAGCAATDVVAKYATASFDALARASGDRVSWSREDVSWVLASPEGDEALFSADFSRNASMGGMADMDRPDAELSFEAAPFLAAGLDPSRLRSSEGMKYEFEEGRLMLHFELGSEKFVAGAEKSIQADFAEIARTQRTRISYHDKLDHYGIKLGGGNMLEWAKDLAKNDKDLVFVLEPGPLVAAGLDPSKVAGWALAKVETRDEAGKAVLADKLLKPFDLR